MPKLPSPEQCSPVPVLLVSNMQMCLNDQCTDLQALGVRANKFILFLPAFVNDERWHLRK